VLPDGAVLVQRGAPAGDYLLVVKDSDMSDGEGFAPFQDTKRVTVR
jgi:hypothetical protein